MNNTISAALRLVLLDVLYEAIRNYTSVTINEKDSE